MIPFRAPFLRRFSFLLAASVPALSLPAAVGTWNGGWPPIAGSYNASSDNTVPLSASVQESPPAITLTIHRSNQSYEVYRKLRDAASWGSPIATLPSGTTSFTDTAS